MAYAILICGKICSGKSTYARALSEKEHAVILSADEMSPLDPETVTAGFCTKNFKVTDENPDTGRKTTRSWDFSAPFNILGIHQGDLDWWADDWGISPEN